MRIDVVSIFPEYFAPLDLSLIGRARAVGIVHVAVHDLRQWTSDVHRTVDDTPYGGGPGMVLRPEPWGAALDQLVPERTGSESTPGDRPSSGAVAAGTPESQSAVLVVPTPAGTPFDQALAADLARADHLIFACGRYEGIDQRVLDHARTRLPVREISLGDYVLFGGEVAVLAILEAVIRLLPGVLGNVGSLDEESHAAGLLEAPAYTKPARWRDLDVPAVLRSGDHGAIAAWRRAQALIRTAERRPDLLAAHTVAGLAKADRQILADLGFPPGFPGAGDDVAK